MLTGGTSTPVQHEVAPQLGPCRQTEKKLSISISISISNFYLTSHWLMHISI